MGKVECKSEKEVIEMRDKSSARRAANTVSRVNYEFTASNNTIMYI